MNYFNALILGIIEGLTEFLPISSTFHLIFFSKLLNIPQIEFQKTFEIFIQTGAVLAIVALYFKTLITNKKLIINLIYSLIPTAILGFIFYGFIKSTLFDSYYLMIGALIIVGLIILILEKLISKQKIALNKTLDKITPYEALLIGLVQCLAFLPGVSRAGAVMIIMLILKYKRQDSALYSFLLAVPTIIGAGLLDLYRTNLAFSSSQIISLIIGFIGALVTALLAIKWFINYLGKHSLEIFAYYRIILAILALMVFQLI
ncbi:MAG TPA: undecaprenyl-diphosphate phosphatase [Candidatus Paceibacterota bacterium]|jgi:undecaprenyl-diphosphatase|nr:undecaprenyl-diphosphate phosphatase [Candidatus Paceibacterota bacterium]